MAWETANMFIYDSLPFTSLFTSRQKVDYRKLFCCANNCNMWKYVSAYPNGKRPYCIYEKIGT